MERAFFIGFVTGGVSAFFMILLAAFIAWVRLITWEGWWR